MWINSNLSWKLKNVFSRLRIKSALKAPDISDVEELEVCVLLGPGGRRRSPGMSWSLVTGVRLRSPSPATLTPGWRANIGPGTTVSPVWSDNKKYVSSLITQNTQVQIQPVINDICFMLTAKSFEFGTCLLGIWNWAEQFSIRSYYKKTRTERIWCIE